MKPGFTLGLFAMLAAGLSGCTDSGGGGSASVVAITTTSANFAVAGNAYTSTLVATGGTPPYTWLAVGGLPQWVSLNPSTGVLTGTPTTSDVGNSNPTFRVTDAAGAIGQRSVLLAVHPRTDIVSVDNSTPPVPGNAGSSKPAISNDGRFVAFASSASNLIPGVSGSQIYLHDWQTNQTSLVSKNNAGNPADPAATTGSPSISSDGRFVVYVSNATNLVTGTTGQQIYLYDTQTSQTLPNGQTTLVSKDNSPTPLAGNGASSAPSISGDGCFVTFSSLSTNFGVAGGNQQIYLRGPLPGPGICLGTEQTSLVSQDNSALPGVGVSSSPSISSNGRFVAFVSNATLATGVTGQQIYLRDVQTAVTSLVSQDNSGNPASAGSSNTAPSISGTGRFVAFVSNATNFGASGQQIYLHDTQVSGSFPNGQTILISEDNTNPTPNPGNGPSDTPSISSDGCFVAFVSAATNLGSAANQIYSRGPLAVVGCAGTEQTFLVSQNVAGNPANSGSGGTIDPSVNGNGQFVAFSSTATNLVSSASSGNRQIYVRATP